MPTLEHFTETGRAVQVEIDDANLDMILKRIDKTGKGNWPTVARIKSVPRETSDDPPDWGQPGEQ